MCNVNSKKLMTVLFAVIILAVLIPVQSYAQLAAGKSKWLGNIIQSSVPANYSKYWNQVSPENSGKWGVAEPNRDSYNWSALDTAYNYAKQQGYSFKQHTFVWGSQEPGWIGSLSDSDKRAEVEEWIRDACQRYPNMDYIDVVNEPLHAKPSYRNALGGDGSTGWDWVIWSFETARKYTNAKLLLNDYNICWRDNDTSSFITIINLLKSRGLIDGAGDQWHSYESEPLTTLMNNVNRIGQAGVDVYISEWEARGDDNTQLNIYKSQFPQLWENQYVKGITLWGYINGTMWRNEGWLVSSAATNATERPALQWIRSYLQGSSTSPPTPVPTNPPTVTDPPTVTNPPGTTTSTGSGNITVRARGTQGGERLEIQVNGTTVATHTMTTSYANYTGNGSGTIRVAFTNDDQQSNGMDIQVDYVIIDGTTYQAENQATNTGVYQNSSCGGSNSEWLHCNGYIEFNTGGTTTPAPTTPPGTTSTTTTTTTTSSGWWWSTTTTTSTAGTTTSTGSGTITVRARGTKGGERLEIQVNGTTVATHTMTTSYANYTGSGSGTVRVAFTNDDQQSNGMDIQVDYVIIGGTTYQAENQATNTGVYQNSSCGGSNSEWLHCNGYIQF